MRSTSKERCSCNEGGSYLLDCNKLPCINKVSQVHYSIRPLSKLDSLSPVPPGWFTHMCTLLWRRSCGVLFMATVNTGYEVFLIWLCTTMHMYMSVEYAIYGRTSQVNEYQAVTDSACEATGPKTRTEGIHIPSTVTDGAAAWLGSLNACTSSIG